MTEKTCDVHVSLEYCDDCKEWQFRLNSSELWALPKALLDAAYHVSLMEDDAEYPPSVH